MIKPKRDQYSEKRFLRAWIIATTIGFVLISVLSKMVVEYIIFSRDEPLYSILQTVPPLRYLIAVLEIVPLALLQKWVLSRWIKSKIQWIRATLLGYSAYLLLQFAFNIAFPLLATSWVGVSSGGLGAVHGTIAGILIGIAQWFVLRTVFTDADWWITATTLSFIVGMSLMEDIQQRIGIFLVQRNPPIISDYNYYTFTVIWGTYVIGGLLIGVITGKALVQLQANRVDRQKARTTEVIADVIAEDVIASPEFAPETSHSAIKTGTH